MLRMAIEYFPTRYRNAPARYLLIAYGQTGKAVSQWPYQSLEDLLEALGAAGISLEKEEEAFMIRNQDVEYHYVLVADKVWLSDSQILAPGLKPRD